MSGRTALHGAVAGALAYLFGYVVTYAWQAPAVDEALQGINALAEIAGGQAIPTWKAVGWLHFNAHFVATRLPALGGGSRLVNFIAESDDGSLALLYVLAVVLPVVAGAAVARLGSPDRVANAAAAGATVLVGYLPLAVVLALAAGHSLGSGVRVEPDLVTAVVLAGVVYPVVFGAAGGGLGHWVGSALES